MRKIYFLWCILLFAYQLGQGQTYLNQNEHQQRLNNGLHLFYTQLPNVKQYEIMLAFRFGSMAEDESNDGLAYVCHTAYLNSIQQKLKQVDASIKVDSRFGFDLCTYQFTVNASQFQKTLEAIVQQYEQAPDSLAFAAAINQNAALFSIIQNTLMYPAEQELIERQWTNRAPAFSLYGPVPMADSITVNKVRKLYNQSYCIEFALLAFSGPESFRKVWSQTQDMLSSVFSCPNELFNTKLANLFPQPKLSSQVVYSVGNAIPTKYQKMYQGAYLSYDPEGALATLVLKQLLLQSKVLDSICDSLGIAQLRLAFDPLQYASALTWHITPTQDSLHVAYANFDTLMLMLSDKKAFSVSEIEDAKDEVIKQYQNLINDPSKKMYLISQYWSRNKLAWIGIYSEMVKKVDAEKLSKVINDYIVNQRYTTLLLFNENDSTTYDFNKFTTTYSSIDSVKFFFQKNTAKFASTADDSTLVAFTQTLLINQDLQVVLNATAYKSELLNAKDDSLANELRKYEGYYIYPKGIFTDTKSYRLDIYRAASLLGILLNSGVTPKQLKGAGVLLKGDDENEVYQITVSPVFSKKKL
jgi:predicted Zn-dependent peptidase